MRDPDRLHRRRRRPPAYDGGGSTDEATRELDLRGLKCPLPALKTQAALAELSPGQLLRVEATDPLAGVDIPNLVRQRGDSLVRIESGAGATIFLIRKA